MTSAIIIFSITLIISFVTLKYKIFDYLFSFLTDFPFQIWRYFTFSFIHREMSDIIGNSIFFIICIPFYKEFTNNEFLYFYFGSSLFVSICFLIKTKTNKKSVIFSGSSANGFALISAFIYSNPFYEIGFLIINMKLYILGIIIALLYVPISIMDHKGYKIEQKKYGKNPEYSASHFSHYMGIIYGILYAHFFLM